MKPFFVSLIALIFLVVPTVSYAAGGGSSEHPPAFVTDAGSIVQHAHFPLPLSEYAEVETDDMSMLDKLKSRAKQDPFNVAATIIFVCAIFHTFLAGTFNRLAHHAETEHQIRIEKEGRTAAARPHADAEDDVSFKATIFHFLGEVEAIFGLWVLALGAAAVYYHGWIDFTQYVSSDVNFGEPIFVVVIMAIASSRPILRAAEQALNAVAKIGNCSPTAWWWSILTLAPILGSFITEPAAMTIGALLLAKKFFRNCQSAKFAYATLGLLFVNVSVGGTLTHFAAPPVLMIAKPWGYDTMHMLMHFGWKAVIGIIVANITYYWIFRSEFAEMNARVDNTSLDADVKPLWAERDEHIPLWITVVHLLFLAWTVFNVHHIPLFVGSFLFFIAFVEATWHHQNKVSLRGPMLVGFFLAGLVIHGGCQKWWIEPIITGIDNQWVLMLGATVLTAFNDNAAITFLASQAPGLAESSKYAILSGAVAGGGLTVIANAPNPAGQSILGKFFQGGISPGKLLLGALIPTGIMIYMFMALIRN